MENEKDFLNKSEATENKTVLQENENLTEAPLQENVAELEKQAETPENISELQSNEHLKQENVAQTDEINLHPNCTLDKKKDEKLKNIATAVCIPFILVAIGLSIFYKVSICRPLSFLFLALGLLILAIFNFIRCNIVRKTCDCKVCKNSIKTSLQWAIIYAVVALGLIGTFIYLMIVNK